VKILRQFCLLLQYSFDFWGSPQKIWKNSDAYFPGLRYKEKLLLPKLDSKTKQKQLTFSQAGIFIQNLP
jgi:hypothetical protein